MKNLKIGIIGAMNEEVVELTAMIEDRRTRLVAGMAFNEGKIKGCDVVVVECGIAKVNAAMCTQILISEFGVGALINTGVAGALHEDLNINDVVISTDAIQYLSFIISKSLELQQYTFFFSTSTVFIFTIYTT